LDFCGKIKGYNVKGFPLSSDMILKFPTVRMFEIGLRNMLRNFHDYPTVNESGIIVFLRQVLWAAGKRKGFERRRGKTKMRPKGGT